MLGVVALIITISVMNGFRENLVQAVLGATAPLRLMHPEERLPAGDADALIRSLEEHDAVQAAAPYFSRQAFLRVGEDFRAVLLRGIVPAAETRVTHIGDFLSNRVESPWKIGEVDPPQPELLEAIAYPSPTGGTLGILLGRPLAQGLGLSLGETLEVISTEQRITPIGPVPLVKRFTLVGVFETGVAPLDENTVLVHLGIAQKLFRMGGDLTGISLQVHDVHDMPLDAIQALAPGLSAVPWSEENRNVFQVMRLEKVGVFLILVLIILVAFFNIIASLVMLVLEKRKAIAILKSLGASNALVRRIFFMQGVWIGAVGTLSGLVLGLLGCWVLATFNLVRIPPGVFMLSDRLPVRVEVGDLLMITGSSFLICLLVTLYPATNAARTNPVENLRNE